MMTFLNVCRVFDATFSQACDKVMLVYVECVLYIFNKSFIKNLFFGYSPLLFPHGSLQYD